MQRTFRAFQRPFESAKKGVISLSLNLSYPYQTSTPKPKKEPLFTPEDSYENLLAIRDDLLDELADLESKRHPTDLDNVSKTLTLRKVQILEGELLRLSMLSLEKKLCRLFGV